MLEGGFSFSYQENYLDCKRHMVYAHVGDFNATAQTSDKESVHDDLEYIFQLIRTHFLCVVPYEGCYPPIPQDGQFLHLFSLGILSLPFKSDTDKSEIKLWNDIVRQTSYEYGERMKSLLRGKCTGKELYELVVNCIEDFEYEDRQRLDANKLANLAAFVYDYCMLTMKEARLYRNLDLYVDGKVEVRDNEYVVPLRLCASVRQYCLNGGIVKEDDIPVGVDYDLPLVEPATTVQNPHANDSYISAMFVDLMHKFFLSFGLQKKGKSQWATAERMLIYELLRLFGLCKSSKPAKESKYVTTVMNDYGDYFTKCNLRSWIREGPAYSCLMCCTPEQLTDKGQTINEPFISLEGYCVPEPEPEEHVVTETDSRLIEGKEIPKDIQELLFLIRGNAFTVTETLDQKVFGRLGFATVKKKAHPAEDPIVWDPRLDYVMSLIQSSFEYITLFPNLGQYLILRLDLQEPKVHQRLVSSLEEELLGRMDAIPRGLFVPDDALKIIRSFREHLYKEERARTDVEKLYVLFLFIFDYVYLTYKESVISPHLRMCVKTEVGIGGENCPSTMVNDDMLTTFLEDPFILVRGNNEADIFEHMKDPVMYVPEKNYPVKHPSCTVKNMTAMFFDLFGRFFKAFGLSKRSDVKYVSDLESTFIGELASCCGICVTDKPSTARTMFMTNKDYFQKSNLMIAIRENEYGHLMLNTMSAELFGEENGLDNTDS